MSNPTIETDISEILKDLPSGQKEIMKEISDVKVSLEGVIPNPVLIQHFKCRLSQKSKVKRTLAYVLVQTISVFW